MKEELVKLNAKVIREHVKANGLKYYWIAEQSGIANTTLRRALSSPRNRMKLDTARKIAAVLGLPVSYIAKEA